MTRVLEIDAGNSSAKWRLWAQDSLVGRGVIPSRDINVERLLATISVRPDRLRLSNVASGHVVAAAEQAVARWGCTFFQAATRTHQAGVSCAYEQPGKMGVDRWLALIAAYQKYQAACVVVDAGSALTVDLVASNGQHLGGYIVPGLQMMRSALLSGTSQVKANDLLDVSIAPGVDTSQAVNHGAMLMAKGLVENSVAFFAGQGLSPEAIITGGDAQLLLDLLSSETLYHWPDLVLDGLSLADEG